MKLHKPKTIKEAVGDLQEFFECDLYSKFRPEEKINGKIWVRDDVFPSKKEFIEYLEDHFNILLKQIKELTTQKNEETK